MKATDWKRILADWAAAFPELRAYGKRDLGRLVGPFFVGILLERDRGGATYLPIAHAHNLASPFPTVSLCLRRGPQFGQTTPQQHPDRFKDLVATLDRDAALPLRGSTRWSHLLEAARTQPTLRNDPFPLDAYELLVTGAAWLEDAALVRFALAEAATGVAGWPDRFFDRFGSKGGFQDHLAALARPRSELEAVVLSECARHGLTTLPVTEFEKD